MGLHNPDLKKIQALKMIDMKVGRGMSNPKIAAELGLHPETVDRRLAWAKKAGLFISVEKEILTRLIPKALTAIELALEDGDAETAMELMKSMGLLVDPKAPKTQEQLVETNELMKAISEARGEETVDGQVVTGRRSLAGLVESSAEQTSEETNDSVESPVGTIKEDEQTS